MKQIKPASIARIHTHECFTFLMDVLNFLQLIPEEGKTDKLLQAINQKTKCVVQMTLTTCDDELCKKIEPHVSTTKERLEALKVLHQAVIPTVVWLCPILPFINDTEANIAGSCAVAAKSACMA